MEQSSFIKTDNLKKKKLIYSFPVYATFIRKDEELMKRHFAVRSFRFNQNKLNVPFSFIQQLIFLLFQVRSTEMYVSFFAGYSSFLPSIFAKLSRKPHLIILGGADCSSFPSINYGNFNKKILGWFTCRSLRMATHLAPVHESLIFTHYDYMNKGLSYQGYRYFCPFIRTPNTTLYTTYDSEKFYKTVEKIPNTFITVAQLNSTNFYRKGIDLIFKVADRFPRCRFTIVGSNNEMNYSLIPKNITILPFVANEELKDILSSHEFYLQLSIQEGLPNALCEAMLCECIPIGSNVSGIPFGIGNTGFILKQRDVNQLERIIKEALSSDKKSLAAAARKRIIDKFPLKEREKLIKLINSLMKN